MIVLYHYAAPSPVSDEVKLLSSMTLAGEKSQTLLKPVSKINHSTYNHHHHSHKELMANEKSQVWEALIISQKCFGNKIIMLEDV